MEKIGKRIRKYRLSHGIKQKELAEKLGISSSYLSMIENGKRKVDAELFMKIIEKTGIDFDEGVKDYFGIKGEESIQKFRKKSHRGKVTGTLKRFQELVEFYSELEDMLNEKIEPPVLSLPEYLLFELEKSPDRGCEKIGEYIRKSLSLGLGPLPDVTRILDPLGIKVFALEVKKKNVSGSFYYTEETGPAILVNWCEPPGRRAFTASHELVHYLFDSKTGFIVDENIEEVLLDQSEESIANKIASSFLIPEDTLKFYWYRIVKKKPERYHINILKSIFGVTYSALLFRCVMVGLIDFSRYHEMKLPREGYGEEFEYEFPDGMPERFLFLLGRVVDGGLLSEEEVARRVGIREWG